MFAKDDMLLAPSALTSYLSRHSTGAAITASGQTSPVSYLLGVFLQVRWAYILGELAICFCDCWTALRDCPALGEVVSMAKGAELEVVPEAGGQLEPQAPGGLSPYNNTLGRPSLYDTYYLKTYQNYLGGDRLPSEKHFRNRGSVAPGDLRPTIDDIREGVVNKVSS